MNTKIISNKPVNSLYFHLTQRNAIIFMAIECKKYNYSHTFLVMEPNGKMKKDFSINKKQ